MTEDVPPCYYRLESDASLVAKIRESGELHGRAPRHIYQSDIPAVKAYVGRLPAGKKGFEFTTSAVPEGGTPPYLAIWRGPRPGVERKEDWVSIKCTVTKVDI